MKKPGSPRAPLRAAAFCPDVPSPAVPPSQSQAEADPWYRDTSEALLPSQVTCSEKRSWAWSVPEFTVPAPSFSGDQKGPVESKSFRSALSPLPWSVPACAMENRLLPAPAETFVKAILPSCSPVAWEGSVNQFRESLPSEDKAPEASSMFIPATAKVVSFP